ncbi:hypothetical protein EG68_04165 [Paragonimus skrjabini miyazakii]|uniref:EF-hand domain-containing protein n=1 Tax=Paragonimus skrjabini miyazakii TaxID=59628 RepID=A0A8S9YTY4_9TREM|nr:hypothetical protein EG68_04165 [Paragonimus skrjabini miyazakii]
MNEKQIEEMFNSIDKNGNGKISRGELRRFLRYSKYKVPLEAVDVYFAKLDLNGDGEITLDELKLAFGHRTQKRAHPL